MKNRIISVFLIIIIFINLISNVAYAKVADDVTTLNSQTWKNLSVDRYGLLKTTQDENESENSYAVNISGELQALKRTLVDNDFNFINSIEKKTAKTEDVSSWLKCAKSFVNNQGFSELQRLINNGNLESSQISDINNALLYMNEISDLVNSIPTDYRNETDSSTGENIGDTADSIGDAANNLANQGQQNEENIDNNTNGTDLDWDKLGGTLLRPFVSFVNFVADTVMKWTGKFMYPEKYTGSDSDEAIMINTAPQASDFGYKPDNLKEFNVNTSDFESLTGNYYPNFKYTPEEIFSGKVDLLNIDFISGEDSYGNQIKSEGWNAIRKVVASWYKVLRLIAIVALLSVLIYTGIRMLISANSKDKAKYKEWILNWFIAVAILFSMHYIMSFTITLINQLSNLMQTNFSGIKVIPSADLSEFTTNLIGFVRFRMLENRATVKLGYLVMYVALVWYTLKFTFIYLKRVINMAFLTLIAPIVAATYPIDKLADGQAQGFQMWIKEYMFTALLQPLHLLLYYVLVGSAIQLAATNVLYGIVALKFISDAEKIFKKIFGFDKAREGMAGGLSSAFAAVTVADKLKDLTRIGKGGGNGKAGNASPSSGNIPTFAPLKDSDSDIALPGGVATGGSGTGGGAIGSSGAGGGAIGSSGAGGGTIGSSGAGGGTIGSSRAGGSVTGSSGARGGTTGSSGTGGNIASASSRLGAVGAGIWGGTKNLLGTGVRKITGWDKDKSMKSNFVNMGGKLARGAVGVGMGATAAAVQAGISITDGQYKPWEGITAFTGGFAAGNKLTGGLQDTFMEGYNANLPADVQRKRAVDDYIHRTDVRDAMKQAFPNEDLNELMERIGSNYAQYGETDTKQIIKNIKNADKLKANHGFDTDVADKQIRLINKQRSKLKEEGLLGKVLSNDAEKDNWARQMSGGDATKLQQYGALIDMMREVR